MIGNTGFGVLREAFLLLSGNSGRICNCYCFLTSKTFLASFVEKDLLWFQLYCMCKKNICCHYCERFSLIFFLLAAAWKPQYLIHANDIANLIKQATWNQKNNRQELYLFIYGITSIANWKIIYNFFWLHSRKYIMSVDLFHNFHYDRIWILNEISCFFFFFWEHPVTEK